MRVKRTVLTSGWGDADQAGDHALDSADDGGLSEECYVEKDPSEQAGGSADVSVQHGQGSVHAYDIRVPSVETCPAHP